MAVEERSSGIGVDAPQDVLAAVAAGRTLPYAWYVDPTMLAIERERIFAHHWTYVARTEQLAREGDFVRASVGGISLVLTRDATGELHALHNVCRHRGSEVVAESSGCRKTLQCGYHAWTYGLNGQLLSAPRAKDEIGFRIEDHRLPAAQIDTFGPFVFVNLDLGAPPLEAFLGPLPGIIASTGVQFDRLRRHEQREYVVKSNWKVVVENFLECYHCPVAHPSFGDVIDLDTYEITEFEWTSTQRGDPYGASADEVDQMQVKEGRYNFLFPTFMLNIYPGSGNVSTNLILPVDAETTLAVYEFFYDDSTPAAEASATTDLIHQVMVEDVELCESVQRGMRSGSARSGTLMLRHEHAISHFQQLVARVLLQ